MAIEIESAVPRSTDPIADSAIIADYARSIYETVSIGPESPFFRGLHDSLRVISQSGQDVTFSPTGRFGLRDHNPRQQVPTCLKETSGSCEGCPVQDMSILKTAKLSEGARADIFAAINGRFCPEGIEIDIPKTQEGKASE